MDPSAESQGEQGARSLAQEEVPKRALRGGGYQGRKPGGTKPATPEDQALGAGVTKEGGRGQLAQGSCWPGREHTHPRPLPLGTLLPRALGLGPDSLPSAALRPGPSRPGQLLHPSVQGSLPWPPRGLPDLASPNEVTPLSLLPQSVTPCALCDCGLYLLDGALTR